MFVKLTISISTNTIKNVQFKQDIGPTIDIVIGFFIYSSVGYPSLLP